MVKYKLESVKPSDDGKTKFTATFSNNENDKLKNVKFGLAGSFSFVDGASERARQAYLARHIGDINMDDVTARGNLSYFITWGPFPNYRDNVIAYRNRFRV